MELLHVKIPFLGCLHHSFRDILGIQKIDTDIAGMGDNIVCYSTAGCGDRIDDFNVVHVQVHVVMIG